MTENNARELENRCNQASKDFDSYNTAVRKITLTAQGQSMELFEMASGHIKANGSEMFKNIEEMKEAVGNNSEIKIEEV